MSSPWVLLALVAIVVCGFLFHDQIDQAIFSHGGSVTANLVTNQDHLPHWMTAEHRVAHVTPQPSTQSCHLDGSFFLISGDVHGSCQVDVAKIAFSWEVENGVTMRSEVPLRDIRVVTDDSREVPTIRFVWLSQDWTTDRLAAANPNDLVPGSVKYLEIRISKTDKAKEPALASF